MAYHHRIKRKARLAKQCIISLFVFITFMANATDPKIDSLKKLGRAALVDLAVEKMAVDHPEFDHTQYDRVIVKANDKSLIVEFTLSVRLKGRRLCYYDFVTIALVGPGTGRGADGDCDEVKFYQKTKRAQHKINFVFKCINKSDEVGHIKDNKVPYGTNMTISEHATYYYVETSSRSTHSNFKVNKLTGKISGGGHKHYARRNEEKSEWEIIGE